MVTVPPLGLGLGLGLELEGLARAGVRVRVWRGLGVRLGLLELVASRNVHSSPPDAGTNPGAARAHATGGKLSLSLGRTRTPTRTPTRTLTTCYRR